MNTTPRGRWIAAAALLAAGAWIWHDNQPANIRAGIERELAQLASERRAIAAQAYRRQADDHALALELGPHMPGQAARLLAESRATAAQADRIELERLATKEARLRARLAALPR